MHDFSAIKRVVGEWATDECMILGVGISETLDVEYSHVPHIEFNCMKFSKMMESSNFYPHAESQSNLKSLAVVVVD